MVFHVIKARKLATFKITDVMRVLISLVIVFAWQLCFSQELSFKADTASISNITIFMASGSSDYFLSHSPSKEDARFYKKKAKLIHEQPSQKNYIDYFGLACSLWELNKLNEAEKMFLTIVNSNAHSNPGPSYHSSDIPGDTTSNPYGYGSYTSNYKNYACRYLAKIYLEEKKFELALNYIELGDKTYPVEYTCGTGHMWYRQEIDGLYGLSYEGLEKYDRVIDLFLPRYSDYGNGTLIRALKKAYSQAEINRYLEIAEKSIVCVVDTVESYSYIVHNSGEKNETQEEEKYISGTATMNLFGRQINLPRPMLKNGEKVSKEMFVNGFKDSGFYHALIDNG